MKSNNDNNDNFILQNTDTTNLSNEVKKELSVLGQVNKEIVEKYLVLSMESFSSNEIKTAIKWIEKALLRAARINYIRKIAGVLYYNDGQYKKAINELNAANRLAGKIDLIYIIADSYRAIGNIEKANMLLRNFISDGFENLPKNEKVEFLIVYASIKKQLGQKKMFKLIIDDAIKIANKNSELIDRIKNSIT